MAGLIVRANPGKIALTGGTAKTCLKITAPTNQRLKIKEWGVNFDGITAAAARVVVELLYVTTAGTFTSLTLTKEDQTQPETIQSTAGHTATSEPTAGEVIDGKDVDPMAGYEWLAPFGEEKQIGGGKIVAIRVNAAANVNVRPYIRFEE